MKKSAIDFSKLLKAQAVFERFRHDMKDDRDQAGAAHAFKFCYELAWKMMKRVLVMQGIEVESPKDAFRKAALAKLIDDPEIWFDFKEKRSLILHAYEQENLNAIVDVFDIFSLELDKMIKRNNTWLIQQQQ